MPRVRQAILEEVARLHKLVTGVVPRDELCRRYMRIPGVGPITALSFKTAIDDPNRVDSAKTVGAYFRLTPKRWLSGVSVPAEFHPVPARLIEQQKCRRSGHPSAEIRRWW